MYIFLIERKKESSVIWHTFYAKKLTDGGELFVVVHRWSF
jgi:hypothetical protein